MGQISFCGYRCVKGLFIQTFLILTFFTLAYSQNSQRGLSVYPKSVAWGKYHALIVGINDYSERPRLQTAVKDATVIRDILVSRYGFEKNNVILRTDKEASRYQVNRDLRYLATSMGPKDNLLIYYAGHGQLDDITGDGYWVPAEGKLKDPTTWISNAYIKALLSSEKVQAKNVVVIADSCYSGSMLRGGPSLMSLDDQRYREKLAKKAALRSRQVISSGGIEPVADGGAQGHSLFAYYFINALENNDRVVVDLENLFHTKVWKPVTEIGDQRPNVGRLKTPMDQDGQFVLYNTVLDQMVPPTVQPAESKSAKIDRAAPQSMNAEEELWAIVKTSSVVDDYKYFLNEYPKGRFSSAARLKIQQLKRKQNAKRFSGVAALTVTKTKATNSITPSPDTPGVDKTQLVEKEKNKQLANITKDYSKVRANSRHTIAIFPSNTEKNSEAWCPSAHELVYQSALEALRELTHRQPEVALRYSYYRGYGSKDKDIIRELSVEIIDSMFDTEKSDQLWVKKSFIASHEPNVMTVTKSAKTINAGIVLMYRYGWQYYMDDPAPIYVYLIDTKKDNIYVASKTEAMDNAGSTIKALTSKVFADFFKNL